MHTYTYMHTHHTHTYFLTLAPGELKAGAVLVVRRGRSGLLSLMVYSMLLPLRVLKTMATHKT